MFPRFSISLNFFIFVFLLKLIACPHQSRSVKTEASGPPHYLTEYIIHYRHCCTRSHTTNKARLHTFHLERQFFFSIAAFFASLPLGRFIRTLVIFPLHLEHLSSPLFQLSFPFSLFSCSSTSTLVIPSVNPFLGHSYALCTNNRPTEATNRLLCTNHRTLFLLSNQYLNSLCRETISIFFPTCSLSISFSTRHHQQLLVTYRNNERPHIITRYQRRLFVHDKQQT